VLSLGTFKFLALGRPNGVTDGGGVRGLSSLVILEHLFNNLKVRAGREVQPHEYFDLIVGTSTGGFVSQIAFPTSRPHTTEHRSLMCRLIAIMLGRLQMTIWEAKQAFRELGPVIFKEKWWTKNPFTKTVGSETNHYFFHGADLEKAVKKLLETRGLDPNTDLFEDPSPHCHVYGCLNIVAARRVNLF
jgi:hypothetical protein